MRMVRNVIYGFGLDGYFGTTQGTRNGCGIWNVECKCAKRAGTLKRQARTECKENLKERDHLGVEW
jgi:hypothetical protein